MGPTWEVCVRGRTGSLVTRLGQFLKLTDQGMIGVKVQLIRGLGPTRQ